MVFVTLTITVPWSQDCQCSIYLYPRKSRKPRKPWFTLHRKITQHYRTIFTQTWSLEKAWHMLLAEKLPSIYIYCLILRSLVRLCSSVNSWFRNWLTIWQIFEDLPFSSQFTVHWHFYQKARKRSKSRMNPHVSLLPGKCFAREAEALCWNEDYVWISVMPPSPELSYLR